MEKPDPGSGIKGNGVDVDLSKLFPDGTDADSAVLESYTHVAGEF